MDILDRLMTPKTMSKFPSSADLFTELNRDRYDARDAILKLRAEVERCKEAIRKIDERELLRETLRFLEDLPQDLGGRSFNRKRAQLMHAIRQLGDE